MDMGGNALVEQRLGQVVQDARKRAGLTQQALCQKSGLSYSTLAKIERGAIKSPSVFTIQQIAASLDISLDELLGQLPTKSDGVVTKSKMVSKNGVRFVYFDMNGCLVRFYNRAFLKLAEDSGVSSDVVETLFWQYNDAVCKGEVSIHDLNTALAQRLEMLVDWKQYYLAAVETMPGIHELVQWVADNYKLGILTNTMPDFIEPMLAQEKIPKVAYDVIIDSSVVHAIKPEERVYHIAAERAGVPASEILLIDDSRANLIAAGKLGWHTLWFDAYRPDESIANIRAALEPQQ